MSNVLSSYVDAFKRRMRQRNGQGSRAGAMERDAPVAMADELAAARAAAEQALADQAVLSEQLRLLRGYYPAAEDPALFRSNLPHWQEMQDSGYFDNHPCYQPDVVASGDEGVTATAPFMALAPDQNVVVIGCGFGRESVPIARRVRHVYGIDVNDTILNKAMQYTASQGVSNFTPVAAADYRDKIPDGIALVFSIVVMQHLTRDLVEDYFRTLGAKLRPDGLMLVQFLEVMSRLR